MDASVSFVSTVFAGNDMKFFFCLICRFITVIADVFSLIYLKRENGYIRLW